MQNRIIFHIDMNSFFASCEVANHPELVGKPVVVGGASRRSVVLAATYEARKFGIHSGMPMYQALQRCPHLVIQSSHFQLYREYSSRLMKLLQTYDVAIEQASIDEAYVDFTAKQSELGDIEAFAKTLQQRIYDELGLPNSIGISYNKFLAKMASDMKKPMGITVIRRKDIPTKIWPLDIGEMFGIGKKSAAKLRTLGIKTIGDFAQIDAKKLEIAFSDMTISQQAYARGEDTRIVDGERHKAQSIGHSITFESDKDNEDELLEIMERLLDQVLVRMEKQDQKAKTIQITIRNSYFKTQNRSYTLHEYSNNKKEIWEVVSRLFFNAWDGEPLRLIGVALTQFIAKEEATEQMNLFYQPEGIEQIEKRNKVLHKLQNKFGDDTITTARKLKGRKKE